MGGGASKNSYSKYQETVKSHAEELQKISAELEKQREHNALVEQLQEELRLTKSKLAAHEQTNYEQQQFFAAMEKRVKSTYETEGYRKLIAAEVYRLEKLKQRMRHEEDILNQLFTCEFCQVRLRMKEVRTFCPADPRLQRIRGLEEEEHEYFLTLRPHIRKVFEECDMHDKGFLDGGELYRVLQIMELADLPFSERARRRQDNERKTISNREKRLALQEFKASRQDRITFDEFWARLIEVGHRVPLYVVDLLFQELSVSVNIGERFHHLPVEPHLREMCGPLLQRSIRASQQACDAHRRAVETISSTMTAPVTQSVKRVEAVIIQEAGQPTPRERGPKEPTRETEKDAAPEYNELFTETATTAAATDAISVTISNTDIGGNHVADSGATSQT